MRNGYKTMMTNKTKTWIQCISQLKKISCISIFTAYYRYVHFYITEIQSGEKQISLISYYFYNIPTKQRGLNSIKRFIMLIKPYQILCLTTSLQGQLRFLPVLSPPSLPWAPPQSCDAFGWLMTCWRALTCEE